jgi:WhiB family redox-sensing transcriptional regulator
VIYGPPEVDTRIIVGWKQRAACAGLPSTAFFPVGETEQEAIEKAKAICAICPVTDSCLEYAFETNQTAGIWGGTTEEERRSLRRRWLTARRRSA